jgi:hypothetical protein
LVAVAVTLSLAVESPIVIVSGTEYESAAGLVNVTVKPVLTLAVAVAGETETFVTAPDGVPIV